MNVLLLGGTGFIGTALSQTLGDRSHNVTVVARNPPADHNADSAIAGDISHPSTIRSAFEGIDVVVNLIALSPLFDPPAGITHDEVHRGGTQTALGLADAHEVDRFVQMSALGSDPDGPTAYIRAKGRAEQLVRESSIESVIIRPSVVFGDGGEFVDFTRLLTTPYVTGLPGGGHTRFQPIWVGDLAPLLADAVAEPAHADAEYELGGPEAITLAEVTKHIYDTVVVLPIPMALAKIGLTIADHLSFVPMGIDQYRSLAFDNIVESNDVTSFGVDQGELRSLADHLERSRS
ncbi:complex I NDUFA9 subunit family protein [Halocatena halophila]|uniref:complex I NDUFA9 subunit family protein n=1 Tax=Halocatena halophila TaxID=2814576 RepID=UPI002ED6B8E9